MCYLARMWTNVLQFACCHLEDIWRCLRLFPGLEPHFKCVLLLESVRLTCYIFCRPTKNPIMLELGTVHEFKLPTPNVHPFHLHISPVQLVFLPGYGTREGKKLYTSYFEPGDWYLASPLVARPGLKLHFIALTKTIAWPYLEPLRVRSRALCENW